MANILSLNNLIDETTGRTNRDVLRGLVHRMAMADYGAITPRSLRSSQRYYACLLGQRLTGWRIRHGLPVHMVSITRSVRIATASAVPLFERPDL
jgi:hypothetical protein